MIRGLAALLSVTVVASATAETTRNDISWKVLDGSKQSELQPEELFQRVAPSVYFVIAGLQFDEKKLISQGSAVAVSPRLLLTNCHVIAGADAVFIAKGSVFIRVSVRDRDILADRCTLASDHDLPSFVSVRGYESIRPGESVFAVGFPKGLVLGTEPTISTGLVSAKRTVGSLHYIQTSAPISSGSSGGGLFDRFGNLAGITTLSLKDAQNINFAIATEDYSKPFPDLKQLARIAAKDMPKPPSAHVDWYKLAAEAENAEAQYTLGELYLKGDGVPRSFPAAAQMFRRAAEKGNLARAQYALGLLYQRGLGVPQNDVEAVLWWQKAADQNFSAAITYVGISKLEGRGVRKDLDAALILLRRAAELDEPNAQYTLCRVHERGIGTKKDSVLALKWCDLAAEQAHPQAVQKRAELTRVLPKTSRERAKLLVREHYQRFRKRD